MPTDYDKYIDYKNLKKAESRIGKKAQIVAGSRFESQRKLNDNAYGEVVLIDSEHGGIWYRVRFPNGYENSYRDSDLDFLEYHTNKQAAVLLEK